MQQVWAPHSKNGFASAAREKSQKVSVLEAESFSRPHDTIIFVVKEFYC
jgi:hypothetical protein